MKKLVFRNALGKGMAGFVLMAALVLLGQQQAMGAMSGTYTIGASGADYATFNAAIAAVTASGGVNGPLVFNVKQGTYAEQVTLPAFAGASALNTITFQADPANTLPAILQFNGQTTIATNFVLRINGASYLTIKGLRIITASTNSTYRGLVHVTGNTNYITFDGNYLETNGTSNNANHRVFSMDNTNTSTSNYTTIINNEFVNGQYSITIEGNGTTATYRETGNRIENNIFSGFASAAIYVRNQSDIVIKGNAISSTSGIGISLWYSYNSTTIEENTFQGLTTGININTAQQNISITKGSFVGCATGIDLSSTSSGVDIRENEINYSGTASATGITLTTTQNATIEDNTVVISTTGIGTGISYGGSGTLGGSIQRNKVEVTGNNGLKIALSLSNVNGTAPNRVVVANNFLTALSGNTSTITNITVQGIYLTNCDFLDVVFNNLYTQGLHTTTLSNHRTIHQTSSGSNVRILNNNLMTKGAGFAIYTGSTTAIATCDYNNYHFTSSGPFGHYGGTTATTNKADFNTWTQDTPYDGNSLTINPQYADTVNSPYDLRVNNSALAGAGMFFAGITDDIDGNLRPTSPNRPYIGAYEGAGAVAYDASVVGLNSPSFPVCAGASPVEVTVRNYGSNTLTSVTINWTVNGVAQAPVTVSGLSIANNTTATVSLGNYNFASHTSYTLAFSSSQPNGQTDQNAANDGFTASAGSTSFSGGTYTIGGASPDFATFNDAVAALANGVCGPVVFNVRQGTYTEQVLLTAISGSSAINTVTFQADPANSGAATLQFNGQSSAATNYVLRNNGASYLRFYNLNILTTNTGTNRGVINVTGSTDNLIFSGNTIQGPISTGGTAQKLLFMDNLSNINNNNTITNNTFVGGYSAIEIPGSSSNYETGNVVNGNTISDFFYRGVDLSYQTDIAVNDNIITAAPGTSSSANGIEVYQCQNNFSIQRNQIEITGTSGAKAGITIDQTNNTSGNKGIVANNFIAVTGSAAGTINGLKIQYGRHLDIAFNNIYTSGVSSHASFSYSTGGNDVRFYNNNVVTAGAGYALNVTTAVTSDYNNFHYTATGNFGNRGGNRADFATWQLGTTQDANSITIDPQYISTSSPFDLHVSNTGLAGKGVAFGGITTDIDGDARTAPPSIGADEAAPPVTATVWTGNVSTEWFDAGNWTAGVPNINVDATIPNVSAGSNRYPLLTSIGGIFGEAKDLDIAVGASVTLPANTRIELSGNFANSGAANMGPGTLRLTNAAAHAISGNTTIGVLEVNSNTALTGTLNVTGALNLVTGNLNTTGGTLRLKSDASTTAYINDFTVGYNGTVTGNVTVERYVANPANGFHYIGAPVNGSTLADWGSEFSIGGPNNAQVIPQPNCNPNGLAQGSPYGGLFEYRESAVTSCYQSGWHVRSGNGTISRTQGYAGIIPNGRVIDLTGTANTGNIGTGALSRTSANATSTQGMHLVSNPYPSALDWYAVRTANPGIDGSAYTWETSGSYQGTYQQINGLTPGNSFIGSSQGFFVEAVSNGATLNFANTMRVAGNNSFFRQGQAFDSRLILEVSGNGYNDRTIVAFGSDFTHGYESGFDSKKMQSQGGVMTLYTHTNPDYPRQATNALPNDRSVKIVPVGFAAGANGTFTFTADDLATFGTGAMIFLEDLKTGHIQNLMADPSYTFTGSVSDAEARFLLHFIPSIEWNTVAASCVGNDGSLVVDLGASEMNGTIITWDAYEITDENGQQVTSGSNANGAINLANLAPGTYTVTLEHDGYTVVQDITVAGVALVDAAALVSDSEVLEGEAIAFSNQSQGATSYEWNFGDGSTSTDANPAHSYIVEGTYTVTLTATNGTCTDVFTQTIIVSKEQGPTGIGNVDDAKGIRIFGYGKTVTVRFDEWADKTVQLDLYDLTGRKVTDTRTLSTNQAQHQLHMGEVVGGYYFVRVHSASGAKVERVYLGE